MNGRALLTQDEVFQMMVEVGAVLDGHFVLTSGRHSDSYVNKDTIFTNPGLLSFFSSIFAVRYGMGDGPNVDVVAGPTIGAVALAQWTAHHIQLLSDDLATPIFIDEGPNKTRIVKRGFDDVVKNSSVLLTEDIMTTAGSVEKSIRALKDAGASDIVGVCVLLNRNPKENTAEALGVQDLFCLVEKEFVSWAPDECPLCRDKVPVNHSPGKGREFLESRGLL